MPSWVVGGVGTFAVSLIVAYVSLRLRCRGIGPPFRRHAWYWALFILLATALVSTGFGLLILSATHQTAAAYVGVIVPIGLRRSNFPPQRDRDLRPRTGSSLLTTPFSRLYDRMGDDMQDWCDARLEAASYKPKWISDAVSYYYDQVSRGIRDDEVRADLDRWLNSIRHKIYVERLINDKAEPARIRAALQMHPSTQNIRRYNDDDLPQLASRLENEALNELNLFLSRVYQLGYHKLLIYPFRSSIHRHTEP
jgi:hypothetical protein